MSDIFKGQQKGTPRMGPPKKEDDYYGGTWWGCRKQWQAGQVPQGGFNPVYRAAETQPVKVPEPGNNFSRRKAKE